MKLTKKPLLVLSLFILTSTLTYFSLAFAETTPAITDQKAAKEAAIIDDLAKASGKTTEEISKMRTEEKMGWGLIAKKLGVHPSVIGNSEKRMEKKKERREKIREHRKERAHRNGHSNSQSKK